MSQDYPPEIQRMCTAVFTHRGETSMEVRQAVQSYVAQASGMADASADVAPKLEPYLKKLTLAPYKIMDEDLDALKVAGYNEDAIFEITVTSALSAGLVRLERALTALEATYAP